MKGKEEVFTLVFNEKWHIEYLGNKYIMTSEPKAVEDGYKYTIKMI